MVTGNAGSGSDEGNQFGWLSIFLLLVRRGSELQPMVDLSNVRYSGRSPVKGHCVPR